jgi:hypothetical protein
MKFKVLIFYSDLAQTQENNDFVANFLNKASKSLEYEINQKSGDKYQLDIDFLHLKKGEEGLEPLFKKIESYDGFFITNSHVVVKHNQTILERIKDKDFFYFHTVTSIPVDRHLFYIGHLDRPGQIAFIKNEVNAFKKQNIFFLHGEVRTHKNITEDHGKKANFKDYSFKEVSEPEDIKRQVNDILSKTNKDDLIILDIGLKYFREVFAYLEQNKLKNRVVNLFGSLENRFQSISFDLIQLSTQPFYSSLSLDDLMNKVFDEEIETERKTLLLDSVWRLEIPILISQALDKCDSNDDFKNKQWSEKLRSAILSFDGKKDVFVGKRGHLGFDANGINNVRDNFAYIFPNSLQNQNHKTPKIFYHTQFKSVDGNVQISKVMYAYIDILSVANIDISAKYWTAEFYLDIVSHFENPIDEIIFNNLSSLNDKFTYKKVWQRDDENNYATQRFYVVANFDFVPKAENYPFDWQNIYISMTVKNDKEQILQPIPLDLLDHEFDIGEWEIQSDFSGVKFQKNRLFQDANLKKSVSINSENRVGWILKRKNNATLFKIGIPMSFLIFLVYYTTFSEYESASSSIGILTTTFLSAIALYFSVEKPEPKKLTIVDLIFIWFYFINGITVVICGISSSISENIFYTSNLILKIMIPLSLISMGLFLVKRIKGSRNDIMLDREV